MFNMLRARDQMRGLPSILFFFGNKFNQFNNTRAQMLDSLYHMPLKSLKNHILGMKTPKFCHLYETLQWRSLRNVTNM